MASVSSARVLVRSSYWASMAPHCVFTSATNERSVPRADSVSLISCFLMARSSSAFAFSSFLVSICLMPALISSVLAAANSSNCFREVASSSFSLPSSAEKSSLRPASTPSTLSTPSPRCRKAWKPSTSSRLILSWCFASTCCSRGRAAWPLDCRKAPASAPESAVCALSTPDMSPCRRRRSSKYSLFCCFLSAVAVSKAASFLATSSSVLSTSAFKRWLLDRRICTRSLLSRVASVASFTAFSLATVFS
mmetsp:Transcript_130313/g.309215  ORF Transcript_130313/g.309215 Transcript_130313/m.309215 type:complete len:250 (+) Transcript_130313:1026-1775(+)